MKRTLFFLSIVLVAASGASGQARRAGGASPVLFAPLDLQVGGTYSYVKPDYTPQDGLGFGIYSTLDAPNHFGGEIDFHQISISQHKPAYERTYEIGVRYHRDYREHFRPFVKAAYGRGVFNFPATNGSQTSVANLAYNMIAVSGGLDYAVARTINIRVEGEYQSWFKRVGLENGLTPILFSVGAAYHFGGKGPP